MLRRFLPFGFPLLALLAAIACESGSKQGTSQSALAQREQPPAATAWVNPEPVHIGFDLYFTEPPPRPPEEALAQVSSDARKAVGAERGRVVWQLPGPDEVHSFSRGLKDDELASLGASQVPAFGIRFTLSPSEPLAGLHRAEQLVLEMARSTHAIIYDYAADTLFAPDAFEHSRLDSWSGETPNIEEQIAIEVEKQGELARIASHGMAKFGWPDVSVDRVTESDRTSMASILNLVCQSLAERGTPFDGTLALDIDGLRHPGMRARMSMDTKPGAARKATVFMREVPRQPGDEDNRSMELVFVGSAADRSVQHQTLLTMVFGSEDSATMVDANSAASLAAAHRAQTQLPELRRALERGVAVGEVIAVKAVFTGPDGAKERMWIEVTRWKDHSVEGILTNQPQLIPDLVAGARVTVKEETIVDYIHRFADGHMEGSETK